MAVAGKSPWGSDRIKYSTNKDRRLISAADKAALPFLTQRFKRVGHPEDGQWQENRLVKHIVDRLQLSDNERMTRIQRMQEIDIQISGFVELDKEDKQRDTKNKAGKAPQPVKHNLSLTYSQLDDCVTYCMSLFAPETNIFIATSTANKQPVAEALTNEIGRQGQTLQYYRQLAKFIYNSFKYNIGALSCRYEKCDGIVFSAQADQAGGQPSAAIGGQLQTKEGIVWEGNVLKSIDMYNFLYDTAVHPVDLPLRGEYFAEVELVTPFRVRRMHEQKILFGIERFVNSPAPIANTTVGSTFYRSPPIVRTYTQAMGGQTTNWRQVLAAGGPAQSSQLGIELAWYTGWINPKEFGLAPRDGYELWQLVLANGMYIASAAQIKVSHGQLPVACACPIEDDVGTDQRTYAELLLPLQHFASFLLNTHVSATRKAIYGITVYQKDSFPGFDMSSDDLIGARVPMKSTSTGQDIDKIFRHYNDAPQTDQNVEMIGNIMEIMQKILPTNTAQQVADLERATEYQAAATVQASNRRNLKIARLINDQAINPIKFQMLYNIYDNMTSIEFVDNAGQKQQITPKQILDAKIEFDIGTGLKGLDRLMQTAIYKDLVGQMLQVPGFATQVDMLGLLSHVTKVAGFETDLAQFRINTPEQAAAIEQGQSQPANANAQQQGSAPIAAE